MSSGSDETDTYSLIDYNPDNEDPKLDNKSTAKLNQGTNRNFHSIKSLS